MAFLIPIVFKETPFSQIQWLIIAALVAYFGPAGDLIESMLKRTLNIKDSGNIMPGHGFEVPVADVYDATESPNGELGFYLVGDGTHKAYRLRVRAPSFVNFSAFNEMVEGETISDVVAILGSMNIIAGELDR